MMPDKKRLITGARGALQELSTRVSSGDKAILDAVDVALTELLLRTEQSFYVEHFAQGLELATAGLELATARVGDSSHLRSVQLNQFNPAHDQSLNADIAWQDIEKLRRQLEDIVRALSSPALGKSAEVNAFLEQVVDWENVFLVRHAEAAGAPRKDTGQEGGYFTQENLEKYLRQKFPEWKDQLVDNVTILPGGFSKTTVLFDVSDALNGKRSLVIRAEQPPRFEFWDGDQVENEFRVLELVHEAGLLVAEPLWVELDKQYFGQNFIVSRKALGENVGSAVGASSQISPGLIEDLIRNLVNIHATRLDPNDSRITGCHLNDWARYKTVTESTSAWVAHWLERIETKQLRPSPLTVRLVEWLKHNVPQSDEPPVLLHGDYGLHNVLIQDDKVSCVLDWEYLNFGDPAEDIAMLCIGLGGVLDKKQIVEIYESCGGRPISEYRLRYFDAVYAMKFIVPAENCLKIFHDHEDVNIALCKIGFQYSYVGSSRVNELITLAEQAKDA